jgi:hypothetical protein
MTGAGGTCQPARVAEKTGRALGVVSVSPGPDHAASRVVDHARVDLPLGDQVVVSMLIGSIL